MKSNCVKLTVLAIAGLLAALAPRAFADDWNQRTVVSFSGPVEIPGQVLPAGTYVFKLVDSPSDRNIVQVFNKNENHLYGTFLTVPDQRLRPAGKTIITFSERAEGAPEAIRSWFYPGETYGHDFVYPKPRAVALAKANNTPVASMPAELAPNTVKPATTMSEPHVAAMRTATLTAQTPAREDVELAEVFIVQDSAPPASTPPPAAPTVPATASPVPLIALAGLISLAAAGAIKLAREAKPRV